MKGEKLEVMRGSGNAGGAYVATAVVAMYAPIVGFSTCHRATIKAHGMQIVAWYTPTTPKGAYMPTTTVGTYAPPVTFPRTKCRQSNLAGWVGCATTASLRQKSQ